MPTPPKRWHVYVVALDPRVGTKPGKQRPCLAIQPTEFGEAGLLSTVVLPLTTRIVREDVCPPSADAAAKSHTSDAIAREPRLIS